MAVNTIHAQIFDLSVANGPDACASGASGIGGPGVIDLYFNGVALATPTLGTILYYDTNATASPVDDQSAYWIYIDYNSNTTPGISVRLNSDGEIIQIFDCDLTNNPNSLYSFLRSNGDIDQTSACAANLSATVYSEYQLSELFNQPTTLYSSATYIPFNGLNKWFVNSGETVMQVNNLGVIVTGGVCNTGSSNQLTLSDSGWNTKDEACSDTASFILYSATSVSAIQTGDFLYTDSGATPGNEYIPTSGDEWRAYVLDGTAFFIDGGSGKIMAIEPCSSGQTYSVWPWNGLWQSNYNDFCLNSVPNTSFFYVSINPLNTLTEIVNAGLYPFTTAGFAGAYASALNAGQIGTPTGVWQNSIFGSTTALPYIWNINSLAWTAGSPCSVQAPQQLYAITVERSVNHNDPTVAEFCTDTKEQKTYYYMYDENSNLSLNDIAVNNIPLYNTANGASIGHSPAMVKTNILDDPNDSDGFYVWINDNNGTAYQWYGFDNAGLLTSGTSITTGGSCSLYQQPNGYGPEVIESPNPFAAKVYYSFWSCVPVINNTQILWPMYLIDGDHLVGQTNHITNFIGVINSIGLNTFRNTPGTECMSYAHKIVATSIAEAELLLVQVAGYDASWVQQVNPAYIGIFSNNTLALRSSCTACATNASPVGTYGFGVIEGSVPQEEGPNLDLEKNYNLDNVSKPLLRTNPKLTTNVKVVVNESDQIFLESIDATKELASVEYKKFELSRSSSYAQDLAAFYNTRRTPAEIIYAVKRESSDLSVLDSYQFQLEETYQAGAISNFSKLHDEDFRIFAPIWLDVNIPKMFVIFKVNNPIDTKGLGDGATDNFKRIQSMLANSEIVKTFDLTRSSAIGNYLRNHVQDEFFPKAPLTFSFENGEKSTYNGIDLKKGGFTTKAEYMYEDFVVKDKPLIEANDLITDGFKRNMLAVANIMNLEFLFNDPTSTDYSVNRYFGLYVDDIDSGYGNVTVAEKGKLKFKSLDSYVNSTIPQSAIPASKMMSETPTLGYVSIAGKYYKIANNKFYDESKFSLNVEDSQNEIKTLLGVNAKGPSVNILKNDNIGYDYIKLEVVDTPGANDKFAVVSIKEEAFKFKFIKHIPSTTVTVEDVHGNSFSFNTSTDIEAAFDAFTTSFNASTTFSSQFKLSRPDASTIILTEKKANLESLGLYISVANANVIRVNSIYTNVSLFDETFFAASPGELDKGTFSENRFSSDGTYSDIAIAIAASVNKAGKFTATTLGNNVYISAKIGGYKLMQHAFMLAVTNNSQFVIAENIDSNNALELSDPILTYWTIHYLKGGHSPKKSCLVTNETQSQLAIGDYLPTMYAGKYNKIIDIVDYTDDLRLGYKKCILTDASSIDSGETKVYHESGLRIGLFSAYDMYDMNFDFYDTSNSDLKELKYETDANIDYQPYNTPITPSVLDSEDIFGPDFILSPDLYFSGLQPLLKDESVHSDEPPAITNEFDRLKENYNKTFALNSRVVPTINKWVLKDAFTCRDNPYYLNANEAFGKTNFTPDITAVDRNKDLFTHEWFYLDKLPVYFRYNMVNDSFSYVNFVQGFELTKDLFKSTTADYFDRFMVMDGLEIMSDSSDLMSVDEGNFDINTFLKTDRSKKYSPVDGGSDLSFASTIFKGIKVFFKNRKEFDKANPSEFLKGTEFNGYRFSTLVKVNAGAASNSIDYEVIQNKKFDFVIFYITLNIADVWTHGYMNRKLMYELQHDVVNDVTTGYEYSDLQLDGALALNLVDFAAQGPYLVKGIHHLGNNTDPIFDVQMTLGEDKIYGKILVDYGTGTTYSINVISVVGSTEIEIKGLPVDITDPTNFLQPQYLSQSQIANASYIYQNGGANAHTTLLNKLSIGYVANLLRNNDELIKYTTIEEDGTQLSNRFTVEFDNGKEFLKISNLTITEDPNIPKSYKLFKGAIGYQIEETGVYYPTLVRHSGNYTVDLTPVVTFTDLYTHFKSNTDQFTFNPYEKQFEEALYKHSLTDIVAINIAKSYYKKYNRTGISFNIGFIKDDGTHDNNWGKIKNHFYHKVNEINPTSVTKLSASAGDSPLYPLIGEIAIDKKDVNVFRSSWDNLYYTRSLEAGRTEQVPGTLDAIEERSYMASTIMTVKALYDLTTFTSMIVNTEEELDLILKNSNNKTDVVVFEDRNRVVIDFYMEDVVYKKLKDDGVLNTLTRFINPQDSIGDKTSLIDDTESYVFKNLLDLYTIDGISLYVRPQKETVSNVISSSTLAELSSTGFAEDTSYTYKMHGQTPLNFRLIYNKRLGYSYDIRPMVKIKS